jgi:hypothetical protein
MRLNDPYRTATQTAARKGKSVARIRGIYCSLVLDARAGGCWCETLPDGTDISYHWTIYGAILALIGSAQVVWSNTRQIRT